MFSVDNVSVENLSERQSHVWTIRTSVLIVQHIDIFLEHILFFVTFALEICFERICCISVVCTNPFFKNAQFENIRRRKFYPDYRENLHPERLLSGMLFLMLLYLLALLLGIRKFLCRLEHNSIRPASVVTNHITKSLQIILDSLSEVLWIYAGLEVVLTEPVQIVYCLSTSLRQTYIISECFHLCCI